MRFPISISRALCAAIALAVITACSGTSNSSSVVPTSGGQAGLQTQGNSNGNGGSTATPYCGGHDRDDCFAFRFILPLTAKISGGALSLSVDSARGGVPCLIYFPERRYRFTVKADSDASLSAITQPDYCAFFEDIGIDGAKVRPMGVATLPPGLTPSPKPTDTPSPTPSPTASPKPGHLYIVEVAVNCKHGDDDGRVHRDGARRSDDDDHRDCDAGRKNTLIGAIAGPGVRDGSGNITFQPFPSSLHFEKGKRYWFFLAKYRDDDPNVPHF